MWTMAEDGGQWQDSSSASVGTRSRKETDIKCKRWATFYIQVSENALLFFSSALSSLSFSVVVFSALKRASEYKIA